MDDFFCWRFFRTFFWHIFHWGPTRVILLEVLVGLHFTHLKFKEVIHPRKHQKWWFGRCISFQTWLFWVAMLDFRGVPKMSIAYSHKLKPEIDFPRRIMGVYQSQHFVGNHLWQKLMTYKPLAQKGKKRPTLIWFERPYLFFSNLGI